MIVEYMLVIIALVWLLFAAIFDIKTREVPDWLSYSLIIIGLGLRLINSIFLKDVWFFLYGVIGCLAMLIFGMIMYYAKQWGGGDTKLIIGLGAVFGSNLKIFLNPIIDFPFLSILLFNLLLFGGIYGIVWGIILALENKNNFLKEFKKEKLMWLKFSFLATLLIVIFLIFINYHLILYYILFGIAINFLVFILIFMRVIENCCMYKQIETNKLVEGDWVAEDIKYKGKIICSKKDLELTKSQIEKLKKLKIKKVMVKEGIPFVPSFFLSLIITLVWGNLLVYII